MTHHRARWIAGVQLVVDASAARGAQLHDGVAALDAEGTGGTARVARDAEKLELDGGVANDDRLARRQGELLAERYGRRGWTSFAQAVAGRRQQAAPSSRIDRISVNGSTSGAVAELEATDQARHPRATRTFTKPRMYVLPPIHGHGIGRATVGAFEREATQDDRVTGATGDDCSRPAIAARPVRCATSAGRGRETVRTSQTPARSPSKIQTNPVAACPMSRAIGPDRPPMSQRPSGGQIGDVSLP